MKVYMVHLQHPCAEIDVWIVTTEEHRRIAEGQGYVDLLDLRNLSVRYEELLKKSERQSKQIAMLEQSRANIRNELKNLRGVQKHAS